MGRPKPIAALAGVDAEHRFIQAAARLAQAKIDLLALEKWKPKECLTPRARPDDIEPIDASDPPRGHACYDQGWDAGGEESEPGPRPWWFPLEIARRVNYCAPCLEAVTAWDRRHSLRRGVGGRVRALVNAFKEWSKG